MQQYAREFTEMIEDSENGAGFSHMFDQYIFIIG